VSQMSQETGATVAAGTRTETRGGSRLAPRAAAVLGLAALTAIGARISVPLPGTAVPFTLQVVAVLLSGLLLGRRLGAASQIAYLAAGVAGLPVFASGGGAAYLLGPTGGYLLTFPIAAAIAGVAAERPGLGRKALFGVLGLVAIHAGGIAWLGLTVGSGAAVVALRPFVLSDVLKLALALLIGVRLRPPVGRLLD